MILSTHRLVSLTIVLLVALSSLAACSLPARLLERGIPVELPEIPGIPRDLQEIDGLLEDLGLPDLSAISELPGIESLPGLSTEPGVLVFRGPTERNIGIGDRIPGTDIELVAVGENAATFMIAGLRSERRLGDSLDFDGQWPGRADVTYNSRLRIYHVGGNTVRAAGVHQLSVRNVGPVRGQQVQQESAPSVVLRFPYTTQATRQQAFPGLTYGYVGQQDRGAELFGLDGDAYPFLKIGDSIVWLGTIRADIPAEYTLRMLYYAEDRAQIGGVVTIRLPD